MKAGGVAVYVQQAYAKPTYARESYNVRAWPGLEMVCDALRRAGVELDYCSAATVGRYRVVLVSITSACDWYPFVAERLRWPSDCGTVIVGGAGVLNVRPFLPYADVFCFGRAEGYIVPLVRATLQRRHYQHPSVCYGLEFSMRRRYALAQAERPYPHSVTLANGKPWKEAAIGCQRKCLFCGYTWQRRHVGGLQTDSGAAAAMWGAGARERTIFELDLSDPDSWDLQHLQMVGLDGLSERLRRMVAKPITRAMWRAFLRGLGRASVPRGKLKVYNLVGLPTERPEDWREFMEDLVAADRSLAPSADRWGIVLHSTSFRAMPGTPAATWPMSYANYRGRVCRALRRREHIGQVFYEGRRLWAVESLGTESLATHILDALATRGVEDDAEAVARIACSRKFAAASVRRRVAILERYLDVARLFREYTWADLPTRYLATYVPTAKFRRADEAARRRTGGIPWGRADPPPEPRAPAGGAGGRVRRKARPGGDTGRPGRGSRLCGPATAPEDPNAGRIPERRRGGNA